MNEGLGIQWRLRPESSEGDHLPQQTENIESHLETLHLGAATDGGVRQVQGIGDRTKAAAPTAREDRQDAHHKDPLCDHPREINHQEEDEHSEVQGAPITDHLDQIDPSRRDT
eukprot:5237357-Amphidinium_carterae.1